MIDHFQGQDISQKYIRVKLSTTGILIACSTLLTFKSMGQETYSVGSKVKKKGKVEILSTTPIQGPFVKFIEKRFTLIVSKLDLIQATKETGALFDEDEPDMMNGIVNYLDTCGNLTFEYVWTKKSDLSDSAWTDIKNIRTLTEKYLQESVCSIIESRRIILYTKLAEKNKFYITGVSTKFGYAKGVFTMDDRLIWICPPFTVD